MRTPNFALTVRSDLRKRSPAQRWAVTYSHGGSQGFKSPHLHPTTQQLRASSVPHRRCSRRPRGRLGPRPGRRGRPNHGAGRCRMSGAVERVQAVAQGGVGLGVQVAVAIEGEADRGMPGPGGDLLGVGAGRDHSATAVRRRSWMRRPSTPAALVAGRHTPSPESGHPQRAILRRGEHEALRSPRSTRWAASSSTTNRGSPTVRLLARVLGGPMCSTPLTSTTISATVTVPLSRSTRLRRSPANSPRCAAHRRRPPASP
jgi:hypothetical protein